MNRSIWLLFLHFFIVLATLPQALGSGQGETLRIPSVELSPRRQFPVPPPPLLVPPKPEYRLSERQSNCGYFARSPGDRPTLGKIDRAISYILVDKSGRRMAMFNGEKVLKEYRISLGFNPRGHKQFEGDGRTPEGKYFIDFKNPNSEYHLALKVSYPNERDTQYALSQSQQPGGAIMIHGWPTRESQRRLVPKIQEVDPRRAYPDRWTAGCIAVLSKEMDEIYPFVQTRTPIEICP